MEAHLVGVSKSVSGIRLPGLFRHQDTETLMPRRAGVITGEHPEGVLSISLDHIPSRQVSEGTTRQGRIVWNEPPLSTESNTKRVMRNEKRWLGHQS